MKNAYIVIISLIFIFSINLCSCADREIIITNIKEYGNIWSLSERRADEKNLLFPESVLENECEDFICKHTTYGLVGTGWQVFLKIKYDETVFSEEITRLKNLCEKSPVKGESDYFEKSAYASVFNSNGCYEYAVINEADKTICYIYLQLIDKKNLIIDEEYIPKGYELEMNSYSFSIYF